MKTENLKSIKTEFKQLKKEYVKTRLKYAHLFKTPINPKYLENQI